MKHLISITLGILICLFSSNTFAQTKSKYTISGYVNELDSKESLIGAIVYVPSIKKGTSTNTYGFYSITLPSDTLTLVFKNIGYVTKSISLKIEKDTVINIDLESQNKVTQEVVITAKRIESDESQMSKIDINVSDVKDIPAFLGEKDVMKVIQLMPGVQKGSEGNAGVYVRGGGPDQNLIILDDAPVYNANHLFGFFSLFNGNGIKSVELYKGGFPARFGGRLSSVIDINMKDGNKKEYHGDVGVGLISSKATFEGPISKKKPSSFIISGRRTYIDVLTRPFMKSDQNGGYFFYDLNAKTNVELNAKNKLYLSGYFGKDKFYSDGDDTKYNLNWGNATGTLRWNHQYNSKLFSNTSLIFSDFKFEIGLNQNLFSAKYYSGIRDWILKSDYDYALNTENYIKAGVQVIYHTFTPSATVQKIESTTKENINTTNAIETGIYIEDDIQYKNRLKINPGLRISYYQSGSLNKILPEPRLSLAYKIKEDLSSKFSFSLMNQYIHLLSNTSIGLPTDLWVPSTNKVKPQQSFQIATGLAKDLIKKDISLSIEAYYKKMNNIINYKEGASFVDIGNNGNNSISWEDNVTSGQAWSYGSEFLIRKKSGKFSGWIGYTLSWTKMQFDEINEGKTFFARYDRRNDISIVAIYKLLDNEKNQFKDGITLSSAWVYGTGNAITMPIASYNTSNGNQVTEFGPRNGFRMQAYHRLDLGIQFHKRKLKGERIWEFSIYNTYARANPFFYYQNNGKLYKVALFRIIPSLSYNYKF
ncbi:MAG: hypothetical protein RLZZ175_34 [Bacteroidota bacterium]